MKLLSILFVLFLAINANAQLNQGQFNDTLNASETVYFYPNNAANDTVARAFGRGNLYIHIVSDSLSGATNVVNDIQYACTDEPNAWVTQTSGTLTSNGAASQTLVFEDAVFGATKWRVRSVGSGTQATRIRVGWRFKPE